MEHPAVTNGLTLSYDPAGDHSFAGWDRFGRIIDQKWTTGTNATVVDEFTYTYDRNSSRLTRGNALNSAFSENYTYDGLDRLVDADRNGTNLQSWGLDQLGNWNSTTRGSTTETRTHNAANEITAIDGSSTYTDSDAAGNMTVMPKADGSGYLGAIYDAWNRMTAVFDAGGTVAEYRYDGAGRRIVKTVGSDTYSTCYNEAWQALETRKS